MKKIILPLACIFHFAIAGAQNRARIGTSFNTGMKIAAGNHLNWLAVFEFGFYVRVDPVEENNLGFIGRFNSLSDPVRYSISTGKWFTIRQNNLAFDGLISFPTKKEYLKVLVGIGLDYALEPDLKYGIATTATGTSGFSVDLDSSLRSVNDYRRVLMPSLSAGILYAPSRNKKFSTYLILEQYLLRLFTEDLSIPYKENGQYGIARINYMPCYLKLGVNYDLW